MPELEDTTPEDGPGPPVDDDAAEANEEDDDKDDPVEEDPAEDDREDDTPATDALLLPFEPEEEPVAAEDAPAEVPAWEDDTGREDNDDALLLAAALDEPVTAAELPPATEEPPLEDPEDEDDDTSPGGDRLVQPTNAARAHKTIRGILMSCSPLWAGHPCLATTLRHATTTLHQCASSCCPAGQPSGTLHLGSWPSMRPRLASMVEPSMQRVRIHSAGGYRALRLETVPTPAPSPGSVRVATSHVGVNYADCVVRMGLYASAKKYVGWPITPGFEFCGHVDALGDGVTGWNVGDAVLGVTRFDGNASHVLVPAHQLWRLPEGMTAPQAAGFPVVFLTAHYALHVLGAAKAGQWALVHSAAGGVGSALLQLCRAAGVHTVGVVGREDKVDAAKSAGATHVLVRTATPWWKAARRLVPDGFHLILDASGPPTLRHAPALLRPTGRLIVYGFHSMLSMAGGWPNPLALAWGWLRMPRFNPLDLTGANHGVLAFNLSYLFEEGAVLRDAMTQLLAQHAQGAIAPLPTREFALQDVAAAHRALESGTTVGKLVLRA